LRTIGAYAYFFNPKKPDRRVMRTKKTKKFIKISKV